MPVHSSKNNVVNWASDIEQGTLDQAEMTAKLPFLAGHVALMPDAHIGNGSTVGSVIPTKNAIVPAAIGVDIGCGMIACKLDITSQNLPDDISSWRDRIEKAIPGGVGKTHGWSSDINVKAIIGFPETVEKRGLQQKAISQTGTLGGGNHFCEIDLDESDNVWVVLHSGSRGVGNTLADIHIKVAKNLMEKYYIQLEERDLAYLVNGTEEFSAYIRDMLWAQDYARLNRDIMMDRVLEILKEEVGASELERINCHHNFTQKENHFGKNIWVTRKGAIKADVGDLGIIPGSMGTETFIVKGKGNPASYNSCAHGAGRRFSRRKARETFTADDLIEAMKGKVWLEKDAAKLVDEIPASYKDINQVMRDQADLVEVVHTLNQILNYKGV